MNIRLLGLAAIGVTMALGGVGTLTTSAQTPDADAAAEAGVVSSGSVENDAQEFTRLVLRHDSLAFKVDMHQATTAERDALPGLRAQVDAIARKYAPGGPISAQAAAYQTRASPSCRPRSSPTRDARGLRTRSRARMRCCARIQTALSVSPP